MASDKVTLRIRKAQKSDIPAMVDIGERAFRGRHINEALFPAHLATRPGNADSYEFRATRLERRLDNTPSNHYWLVAVLVEDSAAAEAERIVGVACWQDGDGASLPLLPSQGGGKDEMTREERRATLPSYLDFEALEEIEAGVKILEKCMWDALGEEGYNVSWYLDAISVDPDYQRRGIGKMLMQWGQDRADGEHKNVRFMSSVAGAKMYRALGYQEVGSLEVLGGMEYAFIKKAG